MKKIGLIVNTEKPCATEVATEVVGLATSLGMEVLLDAECKLPLKLSACRADRFASAGAEAAVVLGGDGTMLDAARRLSAAPLPMMGLNIGSLGYLTCVERSRFGEAMAQLHDGTFDISTRATLSAELRGPSYPTTVRLPDAMNDVVVSRGASGTTVELDVAVDGLPVSHFLCDGIIVATATGSTAYSLSAGGPILLPDTDALVVNMICPHTLTSRPLVLRNSVTVSIRAVACKAAMIVSADGRDSRPMTVGDEITIRRGGSNVPVISLRCSNPWDVMRRKLRWGGR
ncbi:MAG: NAD(+)/NADH kinase [Kiritimatiellae bacterium]|nr:NAD(+)/NADH kinase [Kiritimatiellia bacterium]